MNTNLDSRKLHVAIFQILRRKNKFWRNWADIWERKLAQVRQRILDIKIPFTVAELIRENKGIRAGEDQV